MKWTLPLLLLAMPIAADAAADMRPAFALPADLRGKTVLYVGAHPDDEWGVAPILAEACLERGASCRFIVVSESNSLGCLLTIGLRDARECSRRRRAEMVEAARLFKGSVEFLGLDDLFFAHDNAGVERTLAGWSKSVGGRDALVSRMASAIHRVRPDIVFTFDPRHGSSCHAGHRAAARLALDAIGRIRANTRPQIWLEQTSDLEEHGAEAKAVIDAGGYFGWPATTAHTLYYDASHRLRDGRTTFDVMVAERKLHASQVPDEASGKRVIAPAPALRFVPVSALPADTSADFCTPLGLDRPTLDTERGRAFLDRLMKADSR